MPSEAELRAALDCGDAEIEAGLTVSAAVVRQRMRDIIARIEAKKRARRIADLG